MLTDLYGKTWEVVHGQSDSDLLIRFLNGLDQDDVQRVFAHCREQVSKGNKWAPSLIEMIAYRESPTETEYFMILSRVQANEPKDRVEEYLCEKIRYNLHRQPMGEELKFLKAQYRLAQELEKSGKLRTNREELKALPRITSMGLNDIHREKHKGELHPRIKKIMEGRK